jgi:hypothetical protein
VILRYRNRNRRDTGDTSISKQTASCDHSGCTWRELSYARVQPSVTRFSFGAYDCPGGALRSAYGSGNHRAAVALCERRSTSSSDTAEAPSASNTVDAPPLHSPTYVRLLICPTQKTNMHESNMQRYQ